VRVLRPGGRLLLADVVVQRELALAARSDPELWAACVAGALPEPELVELAAAAGLAGARIVARHDCFRGTSAATKTARDLHIGAVVLAAERPC
jgi:arsenite methyltransferase